MTLRDAQKKVDQWINSKGVRYFNELTNMAILTEEVGEVARIMAREYGEQSYKKKETKEEAKRKLAEELADVLFVTMCIANQTEIDLENALIAGFVKRNTRDDKRHLNNKKLL